MFRNFPLVVFALLLAGCGHNQTPPDEQPLLFLPNDLEATLWAESPMFFNPTNMDVDSRGRIWITEAVNYRNFNNDSTRARHHHKGDRVMILEDTDGDGRADVSQVFVQDKDLISPLGIAVIGNRVFVSCSPDLFVYTDEDGDDIPDHKEILLTGFGGVDHDHSLHAVVGGMDGNLYFNTGNAGPHIVTDKSGWTLRSGSVYTGGSPYNTRNEGNMRSDDGKVWVGGLALRMARDGSNLRVLAHNFRNAYELFVDSRGDMWQNDNDDQVVACRTTWVMEGGNAGYFSSDGTRYWQADHRPWQDVFTAHWHQDDPGVMPAGDNAGAGSPTGVVINEGDALGLKYRGMLLSADAGRNVVFGYFPRRQRSGYDLGTRHNFITSLREDNTGYVWNDSASNARSERWFRPSDVAVGTDGALYVADWYDPVVGGHQMRDTAGYGRIYRIAPKGSRLVSPAIDLTTVEGQLEALRSPAVNVRHTAMEKLVQRGAVIIPQVMDMLDGENPWHHARAIWLLSRLGEEGVLAVERMLEHPDEDTRLVAFRSLRKVRADILPYAEKLAADPSPFVRREVVIALTAVPFSKSEKILMKLADGYDGNDRWYLEALGAALEGHASEIYAALIKRYNSANVPADQWSAKLAALVWRLHPPEAVKDLRLRASSSSLADDDRSKALTALAFIRTPEAVDAMLALTGDRNASIAEEARYWVTFRQGNDWFALRDWRKAGIDLENERKISAMKIRRNRILDARMPPDEKRRAARDMARDAVGARMLLGLVADAQLPPDMHAFVKDLFLKSPDESVRIQAAGYFSDNEAATAYSVPAISGLNVNISAGESIFSKHCAACHRVKDRGQDIGPDLTSINTKFDRKTLLEAIIDPDAGIVFGYEGWTITLRDGQSFFGFLLAENAETLTIKELTGKRVVIEKARIALRRKQEGSLMPSPTALGLTEQNLADLSAYLMNIDR